MERAKRSVHLVATSSETDLATSSHTITGATTGAPPFDEQWSVEQGKFMPRTSASTSSSLCVDLIALIYEEIPFTDPQTIVLTTLPSPPPSDPTTPVPFLHILERLKTTPREGWRRFSIPSFESISDHMYRMSILTVLCPSPLRQKLDIPRCTLLALCHDMAESLVGDITPLDGVKKAEKRRREAETMEYLTRQLLGAKTGCEEGGTLLREAWEEYEDSNTLEAKFVHDIDKLELVIQMMEYERRGNGQVDLGEFMRVADKIEMEEMKGWCRDVLREREEYWKSVGKEPGGTDIAKTMLGQGDDEVEVDGKVADGKEEGKMDETSKC
ncbi:MAG: hypothetical protein L6R38_004761 [Xanthoria sp. 2 TBL-2021]|nr:MAG: hypothetical protein L6R38_004761 [Xanthoria sp. 2 TBL-2021]